MKDLLRNTNSEEEIKIDIGRGIFVSILVDMPFIHIGEWYMKAEEMKPGRKVICLHHTQWEHLVEIFSKIHENIPDIARDNPCYLDDDH